MKDKIIIGITGFITVIIILSILNFGYIDNCFGGTWSIGNMIHKIKVKEYYKGHWPDNLNNTEIKNICISTCQSHNKTYLETVNSCCDTLTCYCERFQK